MGKFLLS